MDNCYLRTSQNLKQGACHTMALPFTLNGILRQKKNYDREDHHFFSRIFVISFDLDTYKVVKLQVTFAPYVSRDFRNPRPFSFFLRQCRRFTPDPIPLPPFRQD